MARLDYYLMITMIISLIWGIFILIVGAMFRFSVGSMLSSYVAGVDKEVDEKASVNANGQNIMPVTTEISNDINLGGWLITLGSLIVVAGALVIVFSCLGFVAAFKQSNPMLILVIIIILAAIGCECWLLMIVTDETNSFHEDAKDKLIDKLQSDFKVEGTGDMFSETLNAIMLTGKCCGVRSISDFGNLSYTPEDTQEIVYFKVAPACCKQEILSGEPDQMFDKLEACAKAGAESIESINTQPCYSTVYKALYDSYGSMVMIMLVLLAIWEVIELVLAVLLIFSPSPSKASLREAQEAAEAAADAEAEAAPKKFVPFSKLSSYVSSDVNRIKSTEIW